jgi:DNA-binding GntR family transcriptional regulator
MNVRSAPLGRRVLREEIKEFLIDAIIRGDLKPGDRVVESRIAQQLGVSQGPVREALRDLELLGFVVSSPYRGTQVRQISNEDLVELYPIRAALESVAAYAAATRIDERTVAQLESLLEQMRAAAIREDRNAHMEADIAFHRLIVEASGNRLLRQFWDSMQLTTTTFLTFTMSRRSLHVLAERHVPLLDTLRAHDARMAEEAMRRHIEEPGEWLLAIAQEEGTLLTHEGEKGEEQTK